LPLSDVVSRWREIGHILLGERFLHVLNPDPIQCCVEIFQEWLQGPATWNDLIEGLRRLGLHSASSKIITMLQGSVIVYGVCIL